MSDYIKREDAIREAKAWSMFGKDDLVSRLERLPSADAVEVVRCKDCKIGGWKISEIDGKTKGYQCPVHAYIQDDNGYCSYGEREGKEHE